jgi:1,2-diacylglycerol 3-beta-galactosyltransferase
MARRVLILTCDSGGGHRSVADAIHGALAHQFPGRYQVHLADIMADGFPFPLNSAGRLYGPVVNQLPRTWGLLWNLTNGRFRSSMILRLVAPLAFSRLTSILRTARPDIVVSTHPWANHIPVWLLQRRNWRLPLVTVVTDPVSIHHWWLCTAVDLCLVPTEQALQKALEAGISPEKVKVVGMPVGLEFTNSTRGKTAMRRELSLAEDRPTMLVTGGGDGMGNIFSIARAVARAELDIQMVIVAGRNEALRSRLEAVSWEVPARVLGFVDNMPDLMHTADLLITKSGPSTISEALCCGLPMLISGGLRGQEEGNAEWVAQTGAALVTSTPQKLVLALKDLVQDGRDRLHRMSEKARHAARPDAAVDVARIIDDVVNRLW